MLQYFSKLHLHRIDNGAQWIYEVALKRRARHKCEVS